MTLKIYAKVRRSSQVLARLVRQFTASVGFDSGPSRCPSVARMYSLNRRPWMAMNPDASVGSYPECWSMDTRPALYRLQPASACLLTTDTGTRQT